MCVCVRERERQRERAMMIYYRTPRKVRQRPTNESNKFPIVFHKKGPDVASSDLGSKKTYGFNDSSCCLVFDCEQIVELSCFLIIFLINLKCNPLHTKTLWLRNSNTGRGLLEKCYSCMQLINSTCFYRVECNFTARMD